MRGVIRNKERTLSDEEALALVQAAEHGVLATVNEVGQPCTVALNHIYQDGVLYFHTGLTGEKLDNIVVNPQVSYFIVGVADVIFDQFTTAFSSAVVNGTMEVIEDFDERLMALTELVNRFSNDEIPDKVKHDFIEDGVKCVKILKLTPEHITGKARLSRKRPCLVY